MGKATPATVLGDFGGVGFEHKGVVSHFFKRDDRFFVRTEGPDGKPADFEATYTFGVDPLQQHLIELPGGKLQALTIAWDVARKRWFHLLPEENTPPGDLLHWTGRGYTANTMCIGCHHDMPAIARATALDVLRGYANSGLLAATEALSDADPAVRRAAVAVLERAPPGIWRARVGLLLSDPVRAVRVEAARILSLIPAAEFEPALRARFEAALGELRTANEATLDVPGSHLNLAVIDENQGHRIEAEQHYLAALRLDPDFTPARLNLARLYSAAGRLQDAEQVLQAGLTRLPNQGELQYSMGLVLAEQRRLPEAVAAFAKAARLLPDRARVQYNYALALQQAGRRPEAETVLLKAQSLAPADRSIGYALVAFYSRDRRWFAAVPWAEKLVALDPTDTQARQLLFQLRARAQQDKGQ